MGNIKRCPVFDCDDCPITSNCKYYSADDGCQYEREDKKAYKQLAEGPGDVRTAEQKQKRRNKSE